MRRSKWRETDRGEAALWTDHKPNCLSEEAKTTITVTACLPKSRVRSRATDRVSTRFWTPDGAASTETAVLTVLSAALQ